MNFLSQKEILQHSVFEKNVYPISFFHMATFWLVYFEFTAFPLWCFLLKHTVYVEGVGLLVEVV